MDSASTSLLKKLTARGTVNRSFVTPGGYTTVLSVTGGGILHSIRTVPGVIMVVTIDGVVSATLGGSKTTSYWTSSSMAFLSSGNGALVPLIRVPFRSSLKIECSGQTEVWYTLT